MKLSQLKNIVKDAVKEAIQEEMKDILLEAVRSSKPAQVIKTPETKPLNTKSKQEIRENYMNVLSGMMPGSDGTIKATTADMPLKVGGTIDTTSPNGSLPEGNVSMDQIMGFMNNKG